MSDTPNILEANGARLWQSIMRSGEIGPGRSSGLCRLALTDSDKEMRDLFVRWCEQADLRVTVDRVGNIFARRPGRDENLAPVLIGSHLDTQAAGGKYDGILGVLAGLEVMRVLNERGIETRRSIEVVNWTNEEGARFAPPMAASAAFAGGLDLDTVLNLKDDDGAVFGAELERIGYAGEAAVGGREIDSYFELHIEQGPLLEAEGIDLGIVTGGYQTVGMNIDIHGTCAHSGPTPMDKRRNALVGAALLIVAANEIGWRHHPDEGKSTAPRFTCWPNKTGILPDYAQVSIDFRSPSGEITARMLSEFEAAIPDCARRGNVDIEIVQRWTFGSEVFDPNCIDTVKATADALAVPYREILSQAGHDAYNMAKICPTALLFSPCREGITHNEAEHIELDYTLPSVNVLLNAAVTRANR